MDMKTTLTAGAIATVLALGACEVQDQRTPTTTPETTPAPQREQVPAPAPRPAPEERDTQQPETPGTQPGELMTDDDQRIRQEIQQLLTEDEMLSPNAANIHVEVRNGVVTLHGEVESDDERNFIVERVWEVQGVMDVVDELTVGQPA